MARPVAPALDPQGMLVFAALAREGGVRRAAAVLRVPRSTVSRRLALLETAVGAPLVVRTARRFALTEVGAAFAERCWALEDLLQGSEELVRRASGEPAGRLRVAVAPVLGEDVLPAVFSELLLRHPRLSLDVRLSPDYLDLRRGIVDVAVRAGPLDDVTDLYATRLGTSVTGHYVGVSYARSRGTPRTPAELAVHDCIVMGSETPASWLMRVGAREERTPVLARARVDSYRLARAMAVQGAGVLRTARIFADPFVATGELLPVLERHWPRTPLHAVHAGPNPPSPKVRAFVELAREAVAQAMT